jgi:hypothetical protein
LIAQEVDAALADLIPHNLWIYGRTTRYGRGLECTPSCRVRRPRW